MTCTHHWTTTSECPMCLRAQLDEARGENSRIRWERDVDRTWRRELADKLHASETTIEEHKQTIKRLQNILIHGNGASEVSYWRFRAQRDEVAVKQMRDALHKISLGAQSSMSSREECGQIARQALEETK